jgi:hypothetical protein
MRGERTSLRSMIQNLELRGLLILTFMRCPRTQWYKLWTWAARQACLLAQAPPTSPLCSPLSAPFGQPFALFLDHGGFKKKGITWLWWQVLLAWNHARVRYMHTYGAVFAVYDCVQEHGPATDLCMRAHARRVPTGAHNRTRIFTTSAYAYGTCRLYA